MYYARFTRARITSHDLARLFQDEAQHGDDEVLYVAQAKLSVAMIAQHSYNHLLLIKPAEEATLLRRDVELEVGRTVEGTVSGPDGEPLSGVSVHGLTGGPFHVDQLATANFTVTAFDPRFERELIFEHRERRLAAYQAIRGDEQGPLAIRLAPCGAMVGRLLDAAGEPLAGKLFSLGRPRRSPPEFAPTSDRSGKFRVEGLVPGLKYSLRVVQQGQGGAQAFATQDVVVDADETKDVGDVVVKPRI